MNNPFDTVSWKRYRASFRFEIGEFVYYKIYIDCCKCISHFMDFKESSNPILPEDLYEKYSEEIFLYHHVL